MLIAEKMHGQQPLRLYAEARLQHADPERFIILVLVKPLGRLGDAGVEQVLQRGCFGNVNGH